MGAIEPQCRGQRLIYVRHNMFEPWGSETDVRKLPCKHFGLEDCEAPTVGTPHGGELCPEGVEEVCRCIGGESASVNDMAEDAVDRTDDHLFHFVKGDGVLSAIEGGRAEEDEYSFDACRSGTLNADDIEELDVNPIVHIDGMGSWSQ